jgi:hypothetical protein
MPRLSLCTAAVQAIYVLTVCSQQHTFRALVKLHFREFVECFALAVAKKPQRNPSSA